MKIIIITGPSGSGKTTISNQLFNKLKNVYILRTDNYYKTGIISNLFSKIFKSYFDNILSLDRELIINDLKIILKENSINHYYKYDFKNKKKLKIKSKFKNIEYLIIEGIFSLDLINLISNYNYLLIKLKFNQHLCKRRALRRDKIERGKNFKVLSKEFINAWNIYFENEKKYFPNNYRNIMIIKKEPYLRLLLENISKLTD